MTSLYSCKQKNDNISLPFHSEVRILILLILKVYLVILVLKCTFSEVNCATSFYNLAVFRARLQHFIAT